MLLGGWRLWSFGLCLSRVSDSHGDSLILGWLSVVPGEEAGCILAEPGISTHSFIQFTHSFIRYGQDRLLTPGRLSHDLVS